MNPVGNWYGYAADDSLRRRNGDGLCLYPALTSLDPTHSGCLRYNRIGRRSFLVPGKDKSAGLVKIHVQRVRLTAFGTPMPIRNLADAYILQTALTHHRANFVNRERRMQGIAE